MPKKKYIITCKNCGKVNEVWREGGPGQVICWNCGKEVG